MSARDAALATLVAVIWGANFLAIDRGLAAVPPLLFVAVRFVLVGFPAVLLVPRPDIPWRGVVLIGLTMSLGQFGLVYLAMHLGMPAGLTPLVLQSQVLFTVLFAGVALRERPGPWQWAGVGLGAAGLVVVGIGRSADAPVLPLVLVVGAAMSWAAGNVLARRARSASGVSLVVWSGLVVPLPMLALSLVFEGPGAVAALVTSPEPVALACALFTAYVSSLLGYGIWNGLLRRHPATAVVPFAMLVPVVGITSAWLVLGEVPSPLEAVGGVLLLAGVAPAAVRRRPRQPRAQTSSAAPLERAAA